MGPPPGSPWHGRDCPQATGTKTCRWGSLLTAASPSSTKKVRGRFSQEWPPPKRLPLLWGRWGHFRLNGYSNMVSHITERGLILKSLLESVKSIKGRLRIEVGFSEGSRLVSLNDSVATCQPPCCLQEGLGRIS